MRRTKPPVAATETDAVDAPAPRFLHFLDGRLRNGAIRVHVAGAGGTGSQVLTGLARLDIALRALGHPAGLQVTVFDPDKVSAANVGRQLFSPADVGESKALVLTQRINMYFGLRWRAFCDNYTGDSAQSADILITCVDSAAARRQIAKRMVNACPGDIYPYWLDLGNRRRDSQVYLTKGGRQEHTLPTGTITATEFQEGERPATFAPLPALWQIPAVANIFDEAEPEDDAPSCSLAQALGQQDLYINQMTATWGLQLLWKLLSEGSLRHYGYYIDLDEGVVNPVPVPPPAGDRSARSQLRCKVGTNG